MLACERGRMLWPMGHSIVVRRVHFMMGDLGAWGWTLIVVGACQGIAGFAVARRSETGRWAGIGLAVADLLFTPAYPSWSLSAIALDLLVIYALIVPGRPRFRPA